MSEHSELSWVLPAVPRVIDDGADGKNTDLLPGYRFDLQNVALDMAEKISVLLIAKKLSYKIMPVYKNYNDVLQLNARQHPDATLCVDFCADVNPGVLGSGGSSEGSCELVVRFTVSITQDDKKEQVFAIVNSSLFNSSDAIAAGDKEAEFDSSELELVA